MNDVREAASVGCLPMGGALGHFTPPRVFHVVGNSHAPITFDDTGNPHDPLVKVPNETCCTTSRDTDTHSEVFLKAGPPAHDNKISAAENPNDELAEACTAIDDEAMRPENSENGDTSVFSFVEFA